MKIKPQTLKTVFKFIAAGSFVALIQLVLLYIFHERLHIRSIEASTIAFLFSILTNFVLQKFWTFEDPSKERTVMQLSYFLLNSFLNIIINFVFTYILIQKNNLNIYFSQAVVLVVITIFNFFVYKKIFDHYAHE